MTGVREQARELLHRRRRVEVRAQAGGGIGHGPIVVRGRRARRKLLRPSLASWGAAQCRPPGTMLRYLAGMTALCSRVDCGEPAAAVFGFDAATALVWLDPFDGRAKGAGMLCAAHADTLTPLRGWTLQDRRVRAPRLWADRPRLTPPTRRSRRPAVAARVRHHHHAEATDPLPFGTSAVDPVPLDRPVTGVQPEAAQVSEVAEITEVADFDRLLDARTPLLTRAFQAARAREA